MKWTESNLGLVRFVSDKMMADSSAEEHLAVNQSVGGSIPPLPERNGEEVPYVFPVEVHKYRKDFPGQWAQVGVPEHLELLLKEHLGPKSYCWCWITREGKTEAKVFRVILHLEERDGQADKES